MMPFMKLEHLQRCQVSTPHDIVRMLWHLALKARGGRPFTRVIDFGAGDARFARGGRYGTYTGIERDRLRRPEQPLPANAQLMHRDAMRFDEGGYNLCIGNPPYIRHHHLPAEWRDDTLRRLARSGGPELKKTANLFIMFLAQALLKTRSDGLVVQLIPFEWVTRPSAGELRDFIKHHRWNVKVYRFKADIFPTVLTTASITIIDKARCDGEWSFGEIDREGNVTPTATPSGTRQNVLPYEKRHETCHALRGLSPGGQEIFVLTEEERLFHSLRRRVDVMPCVTSLRGLTHNVTQLDSETFDTHYVSGGKRCWLIRSDKEALSPQLGRYLARVGDAWKAYTTCTNRAIWWQYRNHPAPDLLVSSGFVGKGPKVLTNEVRAVAVGAVYGVFTESQSQSAQLAGRLRDYDFRNKVVHHSNNLKKIEVKQLNAVLKRVTG
jgi:Eco57I restriction-modification methylase